MVERKWAAMTLFTCIIHVIPQKFKIVRFRPLLVVFQQIMRFIKLSKSIAIILVTALTIKMSNKLIIFIIYTVNSWIRIKFVNILTKSTQRYECAK